MKRLFYDCEIKNCIPSGWEPEQDKYKYCKGWDDFQGMGLSVVGTYVEWKNLYIYYLEHELKLFQELVDDSDEIIGFNSISFDDNLCRANGINITTTKDLLCQVRVAAGMPPHYERGITRGGYSLSSLANVNLTFDKTGSGELAPKLWQDGKKSEVISYCLNDVKLLVELEKLDYLIDPTDLDVRLKMR
jgi:hypothetical protein